jgi:hypothetical protein
MRLLPFSKIFRLWAAALGMGLVAGCAHYRLGSAGQLPFQSIYIAVVYNQSLAAQVAEPATRELRQTFLQEGNLQEANQADADVTLEVVLSDYQRVAASAQVGNSLNAQSYALTLTAKCKLVDNRNGKVYFKDRPVSVTEEAFVQGGVDFNESEYQSIAKLARDLAVKIKDTVVTTW